MEGNANVADFEIAEITGKAFVEGIWGSTHCLPWNRSAAKGYSVKVCRLCEPLTGERSFMELDLTGEIRVICGLQIP
ncbi:MAG: hypothetical protein C4576_23235 [Desulfobacteraceae bacterium]|nr:MAG: hypothetical protein C4576_23235 [Desulfobacteraceae bacterium]